MSLTTALQGALRLASTLLLVVTRLWRPGSYRKGCNEQFPLNAVRFEGVVHQGVDVVVEERASKFSGEWCRIYLRIDLGSETIRLMSMPYSKRQQKPVSAKIPFL